MALPDSFTFSDVEGINAEAERRAIVMFGPGWRNDCKLATMMVNGTQTVALEADAGMSMTFSYRGLSCCLNSVANDLPDGSPAFISFTPDGRIAAFSHYRDNEPADFLDGRPAGLRFNPDGSLKEGVTADGNTITKEEVERRIADATRALARVAINDSEPGVVAVGMHLPAPVRSGIDPADGRNK